MMATVDRPHLVEEVGLCEYCGGSFPDSRAMRRHLRTHTGERPYSCKHCEKTFTQSGALKRHLNICKVRTGEKTHRCTACKRWYAPDKLQTHRCAGEKKYPCPHCNKPLGANAARKQHLKTCKQANGAVWPSKRDMVPHHASSTDFSTEKRRCTGCLNCQRRKTKCDERKPQCRNCERVGAFCEFPSITSSEEEEVACNPCGKFFGRQDLLERYLREEHLQTHRIPTIASSHSSIVEGENDASCIVESPSNSISLSSPSHDQMVSSADLSHLPAPGPIQKFKSATIGDRPWEL